MSATTERLLEDIRRKEDAIIEATSRGYDTMSLREELRLLKQRLSTSNEALTESRSLLKG